MGLVRLADAAGTLQASPADDHSTLRPSAPMILVLYLTGFLLSPELGLTCEALQIVERALGRARCVTVCPASSALRTRLPVYSGRDA